jgi:unsaturated chondroitin disaccharide hydrolase
MAAVALFAGCGQSKLDKQVDHALMYSQEQLRKTAETINDPLEFPAQTDQDGDWKTVDMYSWVSGFFPGCLWYAFENSGEEYFKTQATRWTESMEPVKEFTGNHDIGFMMMSSYGNGYRLTGREEYVDILLQSAESLTTRYHPGAGLIQSWNANSSRGWICPVIIDNMMNLNLLFWAAEHGGDDRYYEIAETHALNTIKTHVRDDGSTFHVVDVEPETGEIRGKFTAQGYEDESTWSRGQAWAIYGFTETYRNTNNEVFLETAKMLADYWLDNIPYDYVPYSDFNAPNIPDESRDTSAAAITASALLELSTLVENNDDAERYYDAALNTIESLSSEKFMTEGHDSMGILRHATGRWSRNIITDLSLIFGDYYFMEAMLRYKAGMGKGN